MPELKTNKELGRDMDVHPRQISKSRRRGWIWRDGKRVKYTAPTAHHNYKIPGYNRRGK